MYFQDILFIIINFDPDNHPPSPSSHILGVRIFVSGRLHACQVFLNSPDFEDQVWARIQLSRSDSLLVGWLVGICHSLTSYLSTSILSLCNARIYK